MGMEIAMIRSSTSALLIIVMLAVLLPALDACASLPGAEHSESAVLPNPI